MKKSLYALAVLGCATVSLSGQMAAGWDFSQFTIGGFNSIGDTLDTGGDFSQAGALSANYTEFLGGLAAQGPNAAPFGTLYYDGTNGSTDAGPLDITGGDTIAPLAGTIAAGQNQADPPFDSTAAGNTLIANGQDIYTEYLLQVTADNSLVLDVNAGSSTGPWEFTFAFQAPSDNAGTLTIDYNDGTGFQTLAGASFTVGTTAAAETVLIPGLDGLSSGQIRLNVDVVGADPVYLDNFGVVPEPSTYALALGVIALVLMIRRRSHRG